MVEGPHRAEGASFYSEVQRRSMYSELRQLQAKHDLIAVNVGLLAEQLTVPRAKMFASRGLGRRLQVVARSVVNVFALYAPERTTFPHRDELTDAQIQLHAFAINVYGVFDNIAWICVLEAGASLRPVDVGLFSKKCQPFLPTTLQDYLALPSTIAWYSTYAKVYRDSVAHRIPIYLPPRAMTAEEDERFHALHKQANQTLLSAARANPIDVDAILSRHEQLLQERDSIGTNAPVMALSLTGDQDDGPRVLFHPQLLSDWKLVHELCATFTSAMRIERGWPAAPDFLSDEPDLDFAG